MVANMLQWLLAMGSLLTAFHLAAGYPNDVVVKGWSQDFDSQPWMRQRNKSPVVSDFHKLVVCSIPKCGSTTFRQ